jgi:hypothetical protein
MLLIIIRVQVLSGKIIFSPSACPLSLWNADKKVWDGGICLPPPPHVSFNRPRVICQLLIGWQAVLSLIVGWCPSKLDQVLTEFTVINIICPALYYNSVMNIIFKLIHELNPFHLMVRSVSLLHTCSCVKYKADNLTKVQRQEDDL